jgi:tRNA A37 threonylcarbamoyladenosine synthetase subunit TsaC/SUA5/YrdC
MAKRWRAHAPRGRPAFNPLIAHSAVLAAPQRALRIFNDEADKLAQSFLSRPLNYWCCKARGLP